MDKLIKEIMIRKDKNTPAERLFARIVSCGGLCNLCGGAGNLMCHQDGKREFWTCPACGGAGCRTMYSKPTIKSNSKEK
jgi:hypothetical protein